MGCRCSATSNTARTSSHFDYVNPDAPKGGTVRYSAIGTFDTLNPFIVKGVPAAGIGQIFDTLMVALRGRARQRIRPRRREASSSPADKLSVLYTLRKEARFHDGTPITPEDVIWTFETLRSQGPSALPLLLRRRDQGREGGRARRPLHLPQRRQPRAAADRRRDAGAVEGILGRHAISRRRRSSRRSAAAPTRSRRSMPAARSPIAASPITGRRICRSIDGPQQFRHHPLRLLSRRRRSRSRPSRPASTTSALENSAKNWATGYDSPALARRADQEGGDPERGAERHAGLRLQPAPAALPGPAGARGARPMPSISNGRTRICSTAPTPAPRSYFDNSELAATGLPQGEELKILEHVPRQDSRRGLHHGVRPAEIRRLRQYPRRTCAQALQLLKEAGWTVKDEKLVNDKTGQPFEFEILLDDPQFERIVAALRAEPRADRHHRARAHRRSRRSTRSAWRPSTTT